MGADLRPATSRAQRWLRRWQARGWTAWALLPLSWLYASLLWARRALYRLHLKTSTRLPVPVVVVGNVVIGGAGKTPTVMGLVQHLRRQGWTPGVVSRGHGRAAGECLEVHADSPGDLVGDEPALIARATLAPMVVGRQRVMAARRLLARHPKVDIIVSDDGMQHWPLARDLTVVVFDERGLGNGWLLPAGMLREPWPASPWGAGSLLVLHTRNGDPGQAKPPPPSPYPSFQADRELASEAVNALGQRLPLQALAQLGPLAAMAGIAQPDRFFAMLQAQGLELQHAQHLPDHADGPRLLAALRPGLTWLCTEKDAVKLFPLLQERSEGSVWAVPLAQTAEPAFYAAIDRALDGLSSTHGRQTP